MSYRDLVLAGSPVLYWAPYTGIDQTANGNDATLAGDTPPSYPSGSGFATATGVLTNGSYYAYRDNVGATLTSGFTIEACVIRRTNQRTGCLLTLASSSLSGTDPDIVSLWPTDGSGLELTADGGAIFDNALPGLDIGFHHLCVKYDASTLSVYHDGALIASHSMSSAVPDDARFGIAAEYDSGMVASEFLNDDVICDAALYGAALTDAEIADRAAAAHEAFRSGSVHRVSGTFDSLVYAPLPESFYEDNPLGRLGGPVVRAESTTFAFGMGYRPFSGVLKHGADIYWGGQGTIVGKTITNTGEAYPNQPVRLHDRKTAFCVDETVSDDQGNYEFRGWDPRREYYVIGFDHVGTFNAVIEDRVKPEPIAWTPR